MERRRESKRREKTETIGAIMRKGKKRNTSISSNFKPSSNLDHVVSELLKYTSRYVLKYFNGAEIES